MTSDRFDQRHQRCGAGANPIGERRDVELDALACIDCALAVERQMQAVLAEQHMREQARAGAPARDRMGGSRRLGDRLAASGRRTSRARAGSPSTGAARTRTSRSRPRRACATAPPHRAGRRRGIDDALARQVLGQRPPCRLAPQIFRHSSTIQVTGGINDQGQLVGFGHLGGMGNDFGFLISAGIYTKLNDPLALTGQLGTHLTGINDLAGC